MKTTIIFICSALTFLFSISASSQTQFTYPMKPGDVEIYLTTPAYPYKNIFIEHSIRATYAVPSYDFDHNDDTVYTWKYGCFSDIAEDYDYTTVNAKGNIAEERFYNNHHGWKELFPKSIAQTDSILLTSKALLQFNIDTALFIISRRFDTTIFLRSVHAFTMKNLKMSLTKTIADEYGFVSEEFLDSGKKYFTGLSSASIKGVQYNWDIRKWNFMPLCVGNMYTYKLTWVNMFRNPDVTYQTMMIMKDTIINSRQYYIVTGDYTTILQGNKFVLLREDSVGIIKYDQGIESILVPSNGTLGVQGHEGMVTDTSTINFYGTQKRKIEYDGNWIEGVGQFSIMYFSPIGQEYDSLIYARVCGVEYGAQVNVENINSVPMMIHLSQNYPNPFSTSTAITYYLSSRGHVRLEVFDLFGRKITTLVDEEKDVGEYTSAFDIRSSLFSEGRFADIHPGIYFYRLTIGNNFQTKKMIVMQ